MAASNWEQVWPAYKLADGEIVLTGPDATGWTLRFYVATDPDPSVSPLLTVTPTIATVTITIPLTKAQMTTTLTEGEYLGALWRIDSGSTKPLAVGRLVLSLVPHAAP